MRNSWSSIYNQKKKIEKTLFIMLIKTLLEFKISYKIQLSLESFSGHLIIIFMGLAANKILMLHFRIGRY